MKTLYLVRHGQTEWNAARRMQGRLDSPLTERGVDDAHAQGRLLKRLGARAVQMFVSPSGRTRETAYIINSYVHGRISFDDALLERDVGTWSGMRVDELEAAFPDAWRERIADPYHFRPPGGENLNDMRERVHGFMDALLAGDAREAIVVTHQVMSRVIVGGLFELTPAETVSVLHPNDLLYRLSIDAQGVDAAYFRSGEGPRPGLLHQSEGETIVPSR